jgi:xylan 1,4-beta-xylosidase
MTNSTIRSRFLRRHGLLFAVAIGLLWNSSTVSAQETVEIDVSAATRLGPWKPIWRYFGYDEPNYTYMKYGRQLLGELAALSAQPVYVRTHNLLTSGNGEPALKWGSTNAYTEDANGRPRYDWTIVDRIFDTYREAGITPFVEIGFMPQALSVHPEPYQHTWPKGPLGTGWSYPPTDYAKWSELVYQWVRHCVDRYGHKAVESWYWELWNEPEIFYWHGTPEEYFKLYDFTAQAVKRALPTARIGGPATTVPSAKRASEYLRLFLEHCASGKNYATGGTGCTLDYISYHAKGILSRKDNHIRMDNAKETADVREGLEIISAFPKFKSLPVVLSEWDPEGCAACSARSYPENAYRNGPMYAAYTAAMLARTMDLSAQYGDRVQGVLTWAFEFEGQPYFDGFRTLATNGIDKPVLNIFRMAGLMSGDRVKANSSAREAPDWEINALAARSARELSVMVWNFRNEDVPVDAQAVTLHIDGLPLTETRTLLTHYRIDQTHSNAYTAWREMGSPQEPTPEQYSALRAAGQLQMLDSPHWIDVSRGKADIQVILPPEAVSLVAIRW